MNKFLLCVFLLVLGLSPCLARNLLLSIHYYDSGLQFDSLAMNTAISKIDCDLIVYTVDKSMTINDHASRILARIRNQKNKKSSSKVFLLCDRKSTFVALDVLSRDSSIVALLTLSGAFNDGDRYLYVETSIKKNIKEIDSISFDRSKEHYLSEVYSMIECAKKQNKITLKINPDENIRELFGLLNSCYGRSLIGFSLKEHFSKIHSLIIPLFNKYNSEIAVNIDYANLMYIGNQYNLKYDSCFSNIQEYTDDNIINIVSIQILNLL